MAENLHKAKKAKNDEFYTLLKDIETEINNYIEYDKDVFRDKVVLCPCDDHNWSNFTKYFVANFDALGLKKLISTSYAKSSGSEKVDDFELNSEKYDEDKTKEHGKLFVLERDEHGQKGKLEFKGYLEGDGDFRSEEVKKLRDMSDAIVTNPPFSLFIEFMNWIVEANKKFLIIGNKNAITYKEVFPLLKDNKVWLGITSPNRFKIPDGTITEQVQGLTRWFTNLEHNQRHEKMELMSRKDNLKFNTKFIKHLQKLGLNDYPKYDNYDAIDVKYVSAIPEDYDGVMGVPITFLDKYNPEQFEIVDGIGRYSMLTGPTEKTKGTYLTMVNGKPQYARIIIKKKGDDEKDLCINGVYPYSRMLVKKIC